MRGTNEVPQGLIYQADFLSQAEEERLMAFVKSLEYEPVTMHGNTAIRTVRHFGMRYDYGSRTLGPGEPIPPELTALMRKVEVFAGLQEGEIIEALINHYPFGAAIGWHHDAPVYKTIIGISLGTPCIMQFQKGTGDERRIYQRIMNPRSAYSMRDDVRDNWQHHIPATKGERYSITLRSLR